MGTKISWIIIILNLIFSCTLSTNEEQNHHQENGNHFDVNNYKSSIYTEKVEDFIKSEPLDIEAYHFVVILNFSSSAQCVQDQFTSNIKKMIDSENQLLLLTDDSLLIRNKELEASNVSIKVFNEEVFNEHKIAHSNPYIYKVKDGNLNEGKKLNEEWLEKINL